MELRGLQPVMEDEAVHLDFANNPAFNKDILKVTPLDQIDDAKLYEIIKSSYYNILEDLFNNVGDIYKQHFQDKRFLNTFIKVLQSCDTFPIELRTYCNHLAYDYLTLPGASKFMKELFLIMSKTVNRDIIPTLLAIGLEDSLAIKLSLARYSSFNERINIQRVNVILVNYFNAETEVEDIVKIYGKLFDRIGVLFTTVMFSPIQTDTVTDELSHEEYDMIEVDGLLGLAVLDILVTQPVDVIVAVLKMYSNEFVTLHNSDPKSVRFSMHKLSTDFDRLEYVMDNLIPEYPIP